MSAKKPPHGYEFKVIVANNELGAAALVDYHGGRGSRRKACSGKLQTQCQIDYITVRRRCGNETYLLASLFAINLIRDLQMQLEPP